MIETQHPAQPFTALIRLRVYQPQTLTRIGGFDPAKVTVSGCCGACGHSATVDLEKVAQEAEIRTLPERLRCSACGSREWSIRIVFTGAGEFEYREGAKKDPAGGWRGS